MKIKFVVTLVGIFFTVFSYAQSNYIVLFKGDTIAGDIKVLSFEKIDQVQISVYGKKTSYTALQVRSLKLDGEFYKAVRYETSVRMMKIVKDGFLSLLLFNAEGNSTWNGRYLLKKDGQGIEVPNLSFKKILSNFLADCPEIKKRFEHGEYTKRDINRIVDTYNACLDAKTKTITTPQKPIEVNTKNTEAIKVFIDRIESENFSTKKDALDLLKDIQAKVEKGEPVPNYLAEGLKTYLKEKPDLQKNAEELLSQLLKK